MATDRTDVRNKRRRGGGQVGDVAGNAETLLLVVETRVKVDSAMSCQHRFSHFYKKIPSFSYAHVIIWQSFKLLT